MLQTQVDYWNLVEARRHNLASEGIQLFHEENQQANWVNSLAEQIRSNRAKESLTEYSNQSGRVQAQASLMSALASQKQADVAETNALTKQREADISQQRADTAQLEAETAQRRADIAHYEAVTNRSRAITASREADIKQQEATTKRDQYELDSWRAHNIDEWNANSKRIEANAAKKQAEMKEYLAPSEKFNNIASPISRPVTEIIKIGGSLIPKAGDVAKILSVLGIGGAK